jgi:hypothetical protein
MLVYVALLMVFGDATTLVDRFDDARVCIAGMFESRRRVGRSYTGFVKQLLKLGSCLLEQVVANNREHIKRLAGPHWQWKNFVLMAVDGSRVNAPRTKTNEQSLGCTKRGKAGPQMWLTTLMHLGTDLPCLEHRGGLGVLVRPLTRSAFIFVT